MIIGIVAKLSSNYCNPMDCSQPGTSVHGISQARILVDCCFLLQGIFLTQGSNLGLPHYQQIFLLLPSEPPGKPLFLSKSYLLGCTRS